MPEDNGLLKESVPFLFASAFRGRGWDAGKIHGPEAPFSIPYDAVPCRSGDLGDTMRNTAKTLCSMAEDAPENV